MKTFRTGRETFPWLLLLIINGVIAIISIVLATTNHDFSFLGEDYPLEMWVDRSLEAVAMTVQDSTHYRLNLTGDDEDEWSQLDQWPRASGRIHGGQNLRLLNAVFFHQFHCIQIMQGAMQDRAYPQATTHHINHCLNYLRQTLLCDADYTLEEGDFMTRRVYTTLDRSQGGEKRVCRDWKAINDLITLRLDDWTNIRPQTLQ